MGHKRISRQELIEKATKVLNAPYTAVDEHFYGSIEWIKTRDKYIKDSPFCELCVQEGDNKKSDDVHHIVLLTAGGEPFLEDNLIALCDSCHSDIHSSGGIAFDLNENTIFRDNPFGHFTTQLKNINLETLSKCKEGDSVILIRERKEENDGYVGVSTKSGEFIGDMNQPEINHYYLAFDIDHGVNILASIKEITVNKNKLKCIIEIFKDDVDWKEYERFNREDKKASELINRAKQEENIDADKSVNLYLKAISMLLEMDKQCEKYPHPWRGVKIPINRLSLILERQKRYDECIQEIETYQKYNDKVGLYRGEKEKIENRKQKILKKMNK